MGFLENGAPSGLRPLGATILAVHAPLLARVYDRAMVMIVILVMVFLMVPLLTRATRPRPGSGGVRWQGIDWERVKKDEPPEPPP